MTSARAEAERDVVGRTERRGVESRHARQRRDGTGRCNPVHGFLVHEQQQAERPGTLVAPTLAGVATGRRSVVPAAHWARREPCPWLDCWCRTWPPVRWIPSTGVRYTVEELPPEGAVRVFRYVYL